MSSEKHDSGWRLVRVGAAATPQILYVCGGCGTVSYFDAGDGRTPDPHCCGNYRAYPSDIQKFKEFLTAKPLPPEKEAALVGKNAVVCASDSRPKIAIVAKHAGRKRKN